MNKQNGVSIGWGKRGGPAMSPDAQIFEHFKAMHHSTMLLWHCTGQHAILKVQDCELVGLTVENPDSEATDFSLCHFSGPHQPTQSTSILLQQNKTEDRSLNCLWETGISLKIPVIINLPFGFSYHDIGDHQSFF